MNRTHILPDVNLLNCLTQSESLGGRADLDSDWLRAFTAHWAITGAIST